MAFQKYQPDHWSRDPERRKEVGEKLRIARLREGAWKGEKNPFYGSHRIGKLNPNYQTTNPLVVETTRRIGKQNKGKKRSLEFREKRRNYMIQAFQDPNSSYNSVTLQIKRSNRLKGEGNPAKRLDIRKKISEANKRNGRMKINNQDPLFIKKRISGLIKKPNKPETILIEILNSNFPNQWEYTGDGKVIINNLNPDFINVSGKKKIIELFGDYWHSNEFVKKIKGISEEERRERYKREGYSMMVIWERETKNPEIVISKVRGWT